ncbi:MAG: integrin alpha, partial [Methylococcales bacterium]
MNNKKPGFHRNVLTATKLLCNPINPSPLSVAIRQTLRATTRRQIAPLVALSLIGLATPALAQDAVVELSSLDGSNGFVLNGVSESDLSGRSVSSAGDVNGDGVDDLLIGASSADPNGSYSGTSYVVFGASGVGSSGTLELSSLDGSNGFVLNGVTALDFSGYSVSAAGDVNGDGVDDLLIGAPGADTNGSGSGASYVVFGASGVGTGGTLELSSLDGSSGFVLNGVTAFDHSGGSVSAAGDVNSDGVDDLLIGANPNGSGSGASYVVFGASGVGSSGTLELSNLDGSNGFVLNGVTRKDYSGGSVSAAGDVNGDGVDDLLIGAYRADPNGNNSGASYVVFGASGVG